MEERYWLRHPSLHGLQGPYPVDELRTAILIQSFPIDSYVLQDAGQSKTELQASPYWRPATDVLGMTQPKRAQPASPPSLSPAQVAHERRNDLRRESAYAGLRTLVTIGATVGIVFYALLGITGIVAMSMAQFGFAEAVGVIGGLAWEVLVIVVVAGALQALFDLADCAQRGVRL